MAYVVLTNELSVDLVDANGAVTRQNVVVPKGQKIPNNVSPFLLNALKANGSLAYVEDGPIPQPTLRDIEPSAQVRTPDLPPVLPSDPVGTRIATGEESPEDAAPEQAPADLGNLDPQDVAATDVDGAPDEAPAAESGEPAARPKASDTKDVWEDYAVTLGVDRAEAESLSKKDLVAAVEEREKAGQGE